MFFKPVWLHPFEVDSGNENPSWRFLLQVTHLPVKTCGFTFVWRFQCRRGARKFYLHLAGVNRLKKSFPFKSTWSSSPYNKIFALNTWTQGFFCLASTRDRYTTNKDYLAQLDAEGLGGKKIQFEDKWGWHDYQIRKFCSEYPPLASQGGAIMLWQCSTAGNHIRLLEKLLPGPDGYSVP